MIPNHKSKGRVLTHPNRPTDSRATDESGTADGSGHEQLYFEIGGCVWETSISTPSYRQRGGVERRRQAVFPPPPTDERHCGTVWAARGCQVAAERCKKKEHILGSLHVLTSNFQVRDLAASGSDMVYAQAVYAIVGALALEQGGQVANRVARERILQPIGLKSGLLESAAVRQEHISS